VAFPSMTPNLADLFFRNAAVVEPKLAGGFTARGSTLVFLNLRGADGQPLSGLDDDGFAAGLQKATMGLGGLATVMTSRVSAKLVEREGYGALTGPVQAALDRLRARRAELDGRR
jgi:hypothetical protein